MRCFRSSIFVLLLVSLTLTGCVGGGGGKGYTVSGKVIDENGKGIAGVEIAVAGRKSTAATTDGEGKYTVTGLTGTVTITPIKPGWCFEPADIQATGARDNVNFVGSEGLYFADRNFELAIRAAIGKPEGKILLEDVECVRHLYAAEEGIQSLVGIENLVQLEELNLSSNLIIDISPLASLVNLRNLVLYDNQITDISPLSGLINLEDLYLEDNQITDITALVRLAELRSLHLSANEIVDISILTDLDNLEFLDLACNPISDIGPLAGITKLTHLYLGWHSNGLTNISALANLRELRTLWLADCKISDISVLVGLTKLTQLHIGMNEIVDISCLAELRGLKVLCLFQNLISDIAALEGLTDLEFLMLRDNALDLHDPATSAVLDALKGRGVDIDIEW